MSVSTARTGDEAVFTVTGSVVLFRGESDGLLAAGQQRFVIDLSDVPVMVSSGLATLVQTFKRVRIGDGDVRVAGLLDDVLLVSQLVRLDRVFDLFPDAAAAAASFDWPDGRA